MCHRRGPQRRRRCRRGGAKVASAPAGCAGRTHAAAAGVPGGTGTSPRAGGSSHHRMAPNGVEASAREARAPRWAWASRWRSAGGTPLPAWLSMVRRYSAYATVIARPVSRRVGDGARRTRRGKVVREIRRGLPLGSLGGRPSRREGIRKRTSAYIDSQSFRSVIFASPRGAVLSYKQEYMAKQRSYASSPW